MNKAGLRKQMRHARQALSENQQRQAANDLLLQLQSISSLHDANKIAMYLANDGEIDPVQVVQWCWQQNKKTFVPMVMPGDDRTLLFAELSSETEFTLNKFGISEPGFDSCEWISASELDLVLMPLVAFDCNGNRIGMGGGFYDATFEFLKDSIKQTPQLVGIAHELQKIQKIESEPWDIPLLTVVTDKQVYDFQN